MSQVLTQEASQALEIPDSPVGFHCLNVPSWVSSPPIEAVVFAWGASEDHQLGLDTEDNIDSPKVVESLLGLRFMGRSFVGCPLVGGSRNTLAIDADGGLWSWGWNDRGTLGHGHRDLQRKPAQVEALAGVRIVQAAIGGWHCLALSDEGQVYCWGGNEYQQCGYVLPDEQQQQSSSSSNAQSKAVNGSAVDDHMGVLLPVRDILIPRRCMPGLRVKQVACGGMNSVVLTDRGDVWTWGEPWGEFALELQRAPRKVPGAVDIAAIACGAFHNMALVADGGVLCWGTNDYGQLGNGSTIYSTTPVEVVDLEDVAISDIAAGGWHSMALGADGQIYVWGRGEYGRLGIADRTGSSKLRPHQVRGLEGHTVVQVAAGGTHSLCVTSAGRMFIWGRASYGRLGLGSGGKDCYSPVEAALPGGHERWKIAAATAGGRHTMCLAVPVRDNSSAQRNREMETVNNTAVNSGGSSRRAANTAPGSRAPSIGASVVTDTGNGFTAAGSYGGAGGGRRLSSAGSGSITAADVTAAAAGSGGRITPDEARNMQQTTVHHQHQQQQQQNAQAVTADTVPGDPTSSSSQFQRLSTSSPFPPSAPLPAVTAAAALSTQSSYSFAPSPGSSILGQGSPTRNNNNTAAAAAAASEVLSGSLSPHSARSAQPLGQGMGVEAVHAATAAAVAAAAAGHYGVLRSVSPTGSSAGGGGLPVTGRPPSSAGSAAAAAHVVGSSLRAGQQAPVSPRAVLPPMSPSQRRVGFELIENLAAAAAGDSSEPAAAATVAAGSQQAGDDFDEGNVDEDDLMQQEEEMEQREQDEMDDELTAAHTQQQQQQQQPRHRLSRQGASPTDTSPTPPAAAAGSAVRSSSSRPGSSEGPRVHSRPGTPASATAAAAAAAVGGGRPSSENSPAVAPRTALNPASLGGAPAAVAFRMRKSGSYQSLPGLTSSSSSPLAGQSPPAVIHQPHSHDAGVLHTLTAARSDNAMLHQQQQQQGETLITGSLTRQQSKQLAAAIASSYSRVDASRMASAASLPSLSAGLGGGSRLGPAVIRVDSDLSHSGGFTGSHEDTLLGGHSPTGSFSGRNDDRGDRDGGSSPTGSSGGGSPAGRDHSITGTSPPGGVYDVSLGEGMARYATSLPEREFIHRNTHVG